MTLAAGTLVILAAGGLLALWPTAAPFDPTVRGAPASAPPAPVTAPAPEASSAPTTRGDRPSGEAARLHEMSKLETAMARVKGLEDKLAALEQEKKAAVERAAEEVQKRLEADAEGQPVDPEALVRAQEEERTRVSAELESRQQDEQRRLEEEASVEQLRLAEERKQAEARLAREAARAEDAMPPAIPLPAGASPDPAVEPGQLLELGEPGVIAPSAEYKPALAYPPAAMRQKVEGTVGLSIVVDETGAVVDVQVVTPAGGKTGLNEAAASYVMTWRFRPATRDGIPVKVRLPLKIDFRLPRLPR